MLPKAGLGVWAVFSVVALGVCDEGVGVCCARSVQGSRDTTRILRNAALARNNNPVEWLTISMSGWKTIFFVSPNRQRSIHPSNPDEGKRLRHRTYNKGWLAEDW